MSCDGFSVFKINIKNTNWIYLLVVINWGSIQIQNNNI